MNNAKAKNLEAVRAYKTAMTQPLHILNPEDASPDSAVWVISMDNGTPDPWTLLLWAPMGLHALQTLEEGWDAFIDNIGCFPGYLVEDPIGQGIVDAEDWDAFLDSPTQWNLHAVAPGVWTFYVYSMTEISCLGPWAVAGLIGKKDPHGAGLFIDEALSS